MAADSTSAEGENCATITRAAAAPATAPSRLPVPTKPKILLAWVTVYFSPSTSQNSRGARLPSSPVHM